MDGFIPYCLLQKKLSGEDRQTGSVSLCKMYGVGIVVDYTSAQKDYRSLRNIDGMLCGIMGQVYTVGVFYGIDEIGNNEGRICFDTYQNAELFLQDWDGHTLPVVGEDGCKAVK